ncbi:MAG: organomercurial lyase [Longimicrobiales bacterium]|nr:organomercurial lyase [Longimicrobiales bacterium]
MYASFTRSGSAPSVGDLAALTGAAPGRVEASLRTLHRARELVLDPDDGSIRMAHPFSNVPTDFPVETSDVRCYGNCVWDAFGILALLRSSGRIETTCPGSGEALSFGVKRWKVESDGDVAVHLLTPLRDAWKDIGFT